MIREEDRYSSILGDTLSQGRRLLDRNYENIEIPQPEIRKSNIIEDRDKAEMIRYNISMDLNDLNYPVTFKNSRFDDYIQSKISSHKEKLNQRSGSKEDEPKESFTNSAEREIQESIYEDRSQRTSHIEDVRRTFATERREVPVVLKGETTRRITPDEESHNNYHELKQTNISFDKNLIKFASNKLNPPRCLLDVLDALFSLLFGVYERIEPHYFTIVEKKYFLFKSYLQHIDELYDVISHLKIYLETQGLPIRNINKADEALVRFNQTVKRPEARQIRDQAQEIANFIRHHIEYYYSLKVSYFSPET